MSITTNAINKTNGQIFNGDDIAKIDNNFKTLQDAINNIPSSGGGLTPEQEVQLDKIGDITTQLSEIVQEQTTQNNNIELKADKITVESNYATLNTKINSQASGSPKGTFTTLELLQADANANTTDGKKYIYVVTASGNWYYWNGSAWTSGGIYQGTSWQEGVDARTSTIKEKTFATLDDRIENIEKDSFVIKNIIKNGDFSDSTTGWIPTQSTLSAVNNTLSVTSNGVSSSSYVLSSILSPNILDNYIYFSAKVRVTNALCNYFRIYFGGTSSGTLIANAQLTPNDGVWYTLSGIIKITDILVGDIKMVLEHRYTDSTTANGKVMEVQYVMAINLTTTFGHNNEYSMLQIEELLSNYPNNWFKDTESLLTMKEVANFKLDVTNELDYVQDALKQISITAITPTASSQFSTFAPSKANDGDLFIKGSGKGWITGSGKTIGEWIDFTFKLNRNKIIACMGDSITAGTIGHSPDPTVYGKADNPSSCYQYHLQSKLPGWTIINKGVGGGNTTQMVARFTADIINNNPDFCIILGGVNDVATLTTASTIQSNLQTMYTNSLNNGIIPIACTILPYNNGTSAMKDILDSVNIWIRGYARDNGIPLIDFYNAFNDVSNPRNMPSSLVADGTHPTLKGYRLMGETIDASIFKKHRYLRKILISTQLDGTIEGMFMPTKVQVDIGSYTKQVALNALSSNKYEGIFDIDVSETKFFSNEVKITILEGIQHPDSTTTTTFTGFGEVQLFI